MTTRRQDSLPVLRSASSARVTDGRWRTLSGLLVGSALLVAAMLAASAAHAGNLAAGPTRVVREGVAVSYGNQGQRAAELRRALSRGPEVAGTAALEPRRLSPEQRAALTQELREAMRNANRPRSVVER
jgi:hypothetical protein